MFCSLYTDLGDDELSDYNDLGLVELWSDESEDISNILYFKHTSQDKMAYTVSGLATNKCSLCLICTNTSYDPFKLCYFV